MIDLLVMTDGRDHVDATIDSARLNLLGPIRRRIIHDDSGDPANRRRLDEKFIAWTVIGGPLRRGFGGAIRNAWSYLRESGSSRYTFHLEDDFVFRRPVDLGRMSNVLALNPQLAQLALRRQPWNAEERAAGGIVEAHPEDWHDRETIGYPWLETRRFFTTNPCLYPTSLVDLFDWPEGEHSEGHFGATLRSADKTFGYWGARDSGEWVEHVGHQRAGIGY